MCHITSIIGFEIEKKGILTKILPKHVRLNIIDALLKNLSNFAVSKDGKFSIEFAECLASCGTGPVCLIGDDFHESVKASDVEELIKNYD